MLSRQNQSKGLEKFSWNYYESPTQRIYLSKDTQLLMEVINSKIAIVYSRTDEDMSKINEDFWKDLHQ